MKGDLNACFNFVQNRFVYKSDKVRFIDIWKVMKLKDGRFHGDCEDFSLTVMWYFYGQNIFKFILNVFILHRSFIWYVKSPNGRGHAVGYCNGYYFDNWIDTPVRSKAEVTKRVGHKFRIPMFAPYIWLYAILGLLVK